MIMAYRSFNIRLLLTSKKLYLNPLTVNSKRQLFCIRFNNENTNLINPYLPNITHTRNAKKNIVKEKKGKNIKPKVHLTEEEMMQLIDIDALQNQLQHALDKLKQNYIQHLSVRTGTGSIENLMVTINDVEFPLNEIAQISRKNPHLIVANLASFPEGLKPVLQAIQESGMNLNPQQDGTVIYIPLPKVTREHRENLSKNAKTIFNQTKDEIRNIQNKFIKEAKQNSDLSEDLVFSCVQQIKVMGDDISDQGEKLMLMKQKELLDER